MIMEHDLTEKLKIWRDNDALGLAPGKHLSTATLYRMAEAGGIAHASAQEVAHLSLCPKCMKQWAQWRKAVSAVMGEMDTGPGGILSFGMRQAAATEKTVAEPVSLPSACGRFVLSLLPQMDDPDDGIVTLEVMETDKASLEGCQVSVRDRNGVLLMTGRLQEGRLARRSSVISTFDLATWTIVVNEHTV